MYSKMLDQNREVAETLETYIDGIGLDNLVQMLSEICREKQDHVLTNWQDKQLAKMWEYNAKHLDRVAMKLETP